MTFLRGVLWVVTTYFAPAALPAQMGIQDLHVEGNHRLKEPAVILASGLRVKAEVTVADLDSAAQRLLNTGLFTGVSYRYTPLSNDALSGYSVTLVVTEEAAREAVVLDIPGVDTQQIWAQLTGSEASLIDRVIPGQAAASAYYIREIESALAKVGHPQRLTIQDESDLATREIVAVVQPVDKPLIADIGFEGNAAVSTLALRERILKVTVGNTFSERSFRRILDANIRPVYEEKGMLDVSFRVVSATSRGYGKVVVTTTIDDGRVWRLGKVDLDGDDLPADRMLAAGKFGTGRIANWSEFLTGVAKMEAVLKHDGYIAATLSTVRSFQPATGFVDVTVKVHKGTQYRFATIEVTGLTPQERQKALDLWKLQAGQPMDGPYLAEYVRSVAMVVRPSVKSVSPSMRVRPGTDQIDVTVTYK